VRKCQDVAEQALTIGAAVLEIHSLIGPGEP